MISANNNLVVSVVVPILNEKNYIDEFIKSVLDQDFDKSKMEVLLVDGMSSDGTRNILFDYSKKFEFIHVIDNLEKKIPDALNVGIKNSVGKYIIRMDAHTYYYPDYISQCVSTIESGNYSNVGGPTVVGFKSKIQKIIAAANYSPFALGGGKSHNIEYEGIADTVSFGTFRRDYLLDLGMYDTSIQFAEDDDLNFRIIENGGSIFISPKIKYIYYPRDSFKSLFVQYFRYGLWKSAVIKKHKRPARISHLVPPCFVLFLIFFPILSLFNSAALYLFVSIIFIYIVLSFSFSFKSKNLENNSEKILLAFTHFVIHVSYGSGILFGMLKFNRKKNIKKLDISDTELRNLQLKNLDLMVKFKDFCNEHKLKFFLCGGGCIGAIRHSGFIPWDDDLDVFMPRDDYEKLSNLKSENFSIVRTNNKIFSGQTFTIVSDNNSTLIKKEQLNLKIPRGVSIDVFPLDGCPKSKLKQKFQMIYACIFSLYTARVPSKNHGSFINFVTRFLLGIVPVNSLRYKIASFCEKRMSRYKFSECEYVKELCAGPKYMKNTYKKEIFESCVYRKFENIELPLPKGYDEYLRTAFGNYMEMPPEDKRFNSHDIVFLDLENSYKKYENKF